MTNRLTGDEAGLILPREDRTRRAFKALRVWVDKLGRDTEVIKMSRAIKLVLATTLFGQVAMAQSDQAAPAAGTAPAPSVDVTVPQKSTLSPQDMLKQANEYRANMGMVLTKVEGMVETSRKDRDVIKLNCLNDKLVQGKANVNVADQALATLNEAVGRSDDGASMYEYTRVTLVNQKVDILGSEAEACIGEEIGYVGATKVDVDVDPRLRQDDPTRAELPTFSVDRPPVASPFR